MLDCILAWANLDGALGMMLATVASMSLPVAAEAIGRMPATEKLVHVRKILERHGATELAAALRRHKRQYEKRIVPRNRIAHARCAGHWTAEPDYLIFAVFERTGPDELAIDRVSLDDIRRSTHWATAMCAMALKIADT